MTEEQFLQLMTQLDSLWWLGFAGFIAVLVGLGLIAGQQR